jgi:hypothetical protein
MEEKYFEDYIFFTFHCDRSGARGSSSSGVSFSTTPTLSAAQQNRPSSMGRKSSTAVYSTAVGLERDEAASAAAAAAVPSLAKKKSFFSSLTSSSSSPSAAVGGGFLKGDSSASGPDGGGSTTLSQKSVCSQVALSLSALRQGGLQGDVETHLMFDCVVQPYVLKLRVERAESLVALDGTDHINPYFIVYVVDSDGNIVKPKAEILGGRNSSSSSSPKTYFFKSKEVQRSFSPLYNEEIEISSVVHDLTDAKYFLIEIWDKNSKSADVCLGEVHISLVSAINLNKQVSSGSSNGIKAYPIQVSQAMKAKSYTAPEYNPISLGVLHAQLTTYDFQDRSAASLVSQGSMSAGSMPPDKIDVTIYSSVKKIATQDCAWPFRFLTKLQNGLGKGVFHLFCGFDGLHIHASLEYCKPSNDEEMSFFGLLEECMEKVSDEGAKVLHLIVPYSKLNADDIFILTDSMVMFSITLRRVVSGGGSRTNKKEIFLDLVVGPCVASDFFTTLHYRITLAPIRLSIDSFVGSKQTDSLVFDQVVKLLQFEIHTAMKSIISYSSKADQSAALGMNETSSVAVQSSAVGVGGSGVVRANKPAAQGSVLASNWRHAIPHRLLVYRHAILKVYFWYLMEYSSALELTSHQQEFSAQYIKQLTSDAREVLFSGLVHEDDERGGMYLRAAAVVRGGSAIGSTDVEADSLDVKMAHMMQLLESNVRSLLYQSFKRKSWDVTSFLDTMIYEQYLLIVGFIDLCISSDKNESAKGERNEEKGMSSQIRGDIIRFIIAEDRTFEKYLNSTLLSNGYEFSTPPLLSLCFDIDKLIGIFSDLLNDNIQMWNTRTLKHFFTNRDKKQSSSSANNNQDFTPWDIVSIQDSNTRKELYISNIPETIQIQLNVQIGLKKIHVSDVNLSAKSKHLIYKMNEQISGAVAKSYLGLASEVLLVAPVLLCSTTFLRDILL